MKTPQEAAITYFLTNEYQYCVEHYSKFNEKWFDIALQKKIFNSIGEQLRQGNDPNVMTVTLDLRTKKELGDGDIGRISKLATADLKEKISIAGIIEACKEDFQIGQTRRIYNNLGKLLSDHSFNLDSILGEAEKIRDIIKGESGEKKTAVEIVSEVLQDHDRAGNGEETGMGLGFVNTDQFIQLEDVDLVVIGARPAMGKTSFAVQLVVNYAFKLNQRVPFFALEMSEKQLVRRIIGCLTGIDTKRIRKGELEPKERKVILDLMTRPEWKNVVVYEGTHTIRMIQDVMLKEKHVHNAKISIVDYLQKIKSTSGRDIYEKVTGVVNELKETTQDIRIPCIALAQLKRDVKGEPKLSDLKNTGDIEQDASIIGFINRPEYWGIMMDEMGESTKGVAEFIIAKNREDSLEILKFNVDLASSQWKPFRGDKAIDMSWTQDEISF